METVSSNVVVSEFEKNCFADERWHLSTYQPSWRSVGRFILIHMRLIEVLYEVKLLNSPIQIVTKTFWKQMYQTSGVNLVCTFPPLNNLSEAFRSYRDSWPKSVYHLSRINNLYFRTFGELKTTKPIKVIKINRFIWNLSQDCEIEHIPQVKYFFKTSLIIPIKKIDGTIWGWCSSSARRTSVESLVRQLSHELVYSEQTALFRV